jgi:hypothetical protein
MFGERIDKMVLDGVWNPSEYWNGPSFQLMTDTDQTLHAFFAGCIETPQLCPLAAYGTSAYELMDLLAGLLERLKYSPIVLGPKNPDDILSYGSLKAAIVSALYFPATWSALASGLAAIIEGNASAYIDIINESGVFGPSIFPDYGYEVQPGVWCADNSLRLGELSQFVPILDRFEDQSWIRGDADIAISTLQCARWKFSSRERYIGTFDDVRTRSPVLIIGNSVDPSTPFASARNLSEGMRASVLLRNNGYGVSAA